MKRKIIFFKIISRFSSASLICIKEEIKFSSPRRKEHE